MIVKTGRLSIFHVFLFAIYPILFLYANNLGEVESVEIIRPLCVVLVLTLVLLVILRLIFKDYKLASVITSFFWILLFFYGAAYDAFYPVAISHFCLILIWLLIFYIYLRFVLLHRKLVKYTMVYFTIISVVLLLSRQKYGIRKRFAI